jgi:hypothetical protein
MSCSRHDVVLLPVPFSDLSSSKVRPAVVIGLGTYPGDLFVVPITSQLPNADFPLHQDGCNAGESYFLSAGGNSHRSGFPLLVR